MYKNHFGLDRRIFRGNVAGADVFVGPQTANILSGIKKAMAGPDAVVTLTGPVGSGKSTTVSHSLSAISGKNAIVRVGRFPLQRGELLDLLFDHMRIQQRPQRGNQKLALFRQLLFNLAENESRMFILVEDAPFLGPDLLAELEVVTAADTGPSDGAAIVLMGDEYLKELLASKPLARLRQRTRLRRNLEPCTTEELGGYLRHCFRQAGGDFDKIFAGGALELLHELSGGILRVVNNLVESSMEAASDKKLESVSLELVSCVADEEFGLTGAFTRLPEISSKQPEPKHSDDATAELVALSMPEPEPESAGATIAEQTDDDIPELIQDTQPALAILNDLPSLTKPAAKQASNDTLPDIEALAAELGADPAIPEAPAVPKPQAKPEARPVPNARPKAEARPTPAAKPAPEPRPAPEAKAKAAPEPKVAAKPAPAPKPEAKPTPESKLDAKPAPAPKPEAKTAPELKAEAKPAPAPKPEAKPAPELKAEAKPAPAPKPAPEPEAPALDEQRAEFKLELEEDAKPAADQTIPTLSEITSSVEMPAQAKSTDDEVPDWDRDPTLAELRPDLDALERAMAVAHGQDPGANDKPAPAVEPPPKKAPKAEIEDIPEITLDDSINRKVDMAALERKKRLEKEGVIDEQEEKSVKAEVSEEEKAREEKSVAELEKIAEGLARAKTIEDVDDKMAETLFGEELSVAAAAVAARVAEEAAAAAASASESPGTAQPAGAEAPSKTSMEKEFEHVWGEKPDVEVSIDSETENQKGGLDISASQRLATVRSLSTGNPDDAAQRNSGKATEPAVKPDPIEEQITTSLTQTMKALKVNPDPAAINDDDNDDDGRKRGFFSRFRRS